MADRRTLDRALSRLGAASRGEAREWIAAGRVTVNGTPALDPEAWVDPECDRIAVDGRPVEPAARRVLALHKPVGTVTTRSDPEGRPTVYTLLGDVGTYVAPVGRLDLDSSGLLLLTNDGDLADRITRPDGHVPKTYRVSIAPPLDERALAALRAGPTLSDGPTRPSVVEVVKMTRSRMDLSIAITEGRNRQVRRMVRAAGSRVKSLCRTAIGPIALGDLSPGRWRDLTNAEVAALRDCCARSS